MVAAVLEETSRILGADCRECPTQRLYQSIAGAGFGFAQEPLDFREGFFDGVEIGRVGWQVQKFATSGLDQLPDPFSFVSRKVVHHHYLPGS